MSGASTFDSMAMLGQDRGLTFLTAEWRYLAMLNYEVGASLLARHLPRGVELDAWHGTTYLSVVGFLFRDTRVLGVPVPLHRDFEEVNLRFYVRREVGDEVRRGVTFIREIVARPAIAFVARALYNEPYLTLPMRHRIEPGAGGATPTVVEYGWRSRAGWSSLSVAPTGEAAPSKVGSLEEFITEHHWGYTRQRDGGTIEYPVSHPRWRVWRTTRSALTGDLGALYGDELGAVLARPADSAFLAEGSGVVVGRALRA
jgi:uncharacterized protein